MTAIKENTPGAAGFNAPPRWIGSFKTGADSAPFHDCCRSLKSVEFRSSAAVFEVPVAFRAQCQPSFQARWQVRGPSPSTIVGAPGCVKAALATLGATRPWPTRATPVGCGVWRRARSAVSRCETRSPISLPLGAQRYSPKRSCTPLHGLE